MAVDLTNIKEALFFAVQSSKDLIVIFDEDGKILFVNDAAKSLIGYSPDELLGTYITMLESPLEPEERKKERRETLVGSKIFRGVSIRKRSDGTLIYLQETLIPVVLNGLRLFVLMGRDIKEEAFFDSSLAPIIDFDPLTGLLHTKGFIQALRAEIQTKRPKRVNLLVLDICQFSAILVGKGYSFANSLLSKVAERLENNIPDDAILARSEKDEFLLFLSGRRREDISALVRRILDLFLEPFVIEGVEMYVSVNIGGSAYPSDGNEPVELIRKAFLALERAKDMGENKYAFYSRELDNFVRAHLSTREEIIGALKERRILLYAQPIFSTSERKLKGLEVLSRIRTKSGIIMSPGEFIPFLRQTGLLSKFDEVLCESLEGVVATLGKGIFLTLNLFPESVRSEEVIKRLESLKRKCDFPLYCEITETGIVEKETADFVERLRDMGIKIAIDDFGTGYNSFSYLEYLTVDMIKVSIELVRSVALKPKTLAIVQSIVDLGKKLRIETCAEGVEAEDQVKILGLLMCDYVQGFYFSRPAPIETYKVPVE
ncbi:MAG: EAL domain-containing protein [Desulfobacterota bacterium]|nr:EAL domain-containing protein [Thermodesulfobacteriota bacterium]